MTGLEKLQEIGAHKIYEQTHIAKKFVEDILNQNFSTMNKIQFSGFISILEREYAVDLHTLLEAYNLYHNKSQNSEDEPFVISEQEEAKAQSANKTLYGVIAVLILALVVFIATSSSEKEVVHEEHLETPEKNIEQELNNTTIEAAKATLSHLGNTTVKPETKPEVPVAVEPMHTGKFEIIPRSKLWIGIVDLENYKRSQRLSADPFELDADKEWLLVMGHGYVNFEVNGVEHKFKDENKVWFSYENGTLTKLSRSDFKEKNRGKAW